MRKIDSLEDAVSERADSAPGRQGADLTWRHEFGNFTFWNVDPTKIVPPIIVHEPPFLTELNGAVITPREIDPKTQGPRKGALRFAKGGVYDSDLNLLPVFLQRETFEAAERATNILKNDPVLPRDELVDAEDMPGKYVYLGILRGHFGHFLLESISRMWYMLKADRDTKIIVHGSGVDDRLPSYVKYIFQLLDIDLDRVVAATHTMRIEHLFFPQSEFEIRWRANASYANLFRELYNRNKRLFPIRSTPKRVYLTRRQLKLKTARDHRKAVANEAQVEALFAARGFEIIAPEKIPFHEQIAIAGGANQLAGLKGSALHMSLFNQRSQSRLIQLGRTQTMNQCLIDGLKNMQAHHIMCEAAKTDAGSVVDLDIVHAALRAM
jgi:hypothetical protein